MKQVGYSDYSDCTMSRKDQLFKGLIKKAFFASIPVMLAYVSIGITFGLVVTASGLPWWFAPLTALTVYAGASQFMGAGMLASGAGIPELAFLTFIMNARHMFYGISVLDKYSEAKKSKAYLVFSLTDETFGLVTSMQVPEGQNPVHFYTVLSALNQLWWFSGCFLGAILGKAMPFNTEGLDFAMVALFTVLLVEQIKQVKRPEPYLSAVAASVLAWLLVKPENFMLVATIVSCILLLVFKSFFKKTYADREKQE